MSTSSVTLEACAKVNLRLLVLGRETTGYHSLETLFCGISLADTVTVAPGPPGIELQVSGDVDVGPPEHNLARRAAEGFFDAAGIPPAIRLGLEKKVPSAAGLGGGSADAATVLRALSELYEHPLARHTLLQIGSTLGSDVPFFLCRTPFALAWGRGERLLELPTLQPRPVVIGHPGTSLPTSAAFARLAELRGGESVARPDILPADALTSWEGVASHAANDFEFVAFERIPGLPNALRTLIEAGAAIALLAGSGASIFGVFRDESEAEQGAHALAARGFTTWQAYTLERWPSAQVRD